jgi:pimeloyl-ACP methyl ester carboxylesterase
MKRMPVQYFTRRQQAEEWLSDEISDWAFRKFLVSNLARVEGGGFEWVINLRILESALPNLFKQVPEMGETYPGKVLFLRGERSHFVEDFDFEMIREFFPAVDIVTIPESGHNVHFDQPERFVEAIVQHHT